MAAMTNSQRLHFVFFVFLVTLCSDRAVRQSAAFACARCLGESPELLGDQPRTRFFKLHKLIHIIFVHTHARDKQQLESEI
jgi:hypothetical protein